jgi:hypothetical protein
VGSIERFRRGGDHQSSGNSGTSAPPPARARPPARSVGGGGAGLQRHDGVAVGAEDVSFVGQPVEYEESPFSFEQSWQMLSPSMQEWVQHRAGPPIRDPHTAVPTVYAYCRVVPEAPGPLDGVTGASYELMAFGKRGLVVSDGTTAHLVTGPGATRWRHRRFDLPVDPAGVRNDHRRSAPAVPPDPVGGVGGAAGWGDGSGWVGPAGGALQIGVSGGQQAGFLPSEVAELFGNLPLPTQRFLLEPFTRTGRPPVQARVHPAVLERGAECREVFWVGLFNAGWLAFACAERRIVRRGGPGGPGLWLDPVDTEALRRAPWDVAAWVAPIDKAAGRAAGSAPGAGAGVGAGWSGGPGGPGDPGGPAGGWSGGPGGPAGGWSGGPGGAAGLGRPGWPGGPGGMTG